MPTRDTLERKVAAGVRRDLINLRSEDLVCRGLAEYSTGSAHCGGDVIPHISTVGLDVYRFIALEERNAGSKKQSP